MNLMVRKRSSNVILTMVLIFGPFLLAPLLEFLHFPSSVKYVLDCTWFLLLVTMIIRKRRLNNSGINILVLWVGIYITYVMLNYILHFQSIFYFFWGFRNNFRFYVLFFAVAFYLNESDAKSSYSFFNLFFYINAGLMFIQYFVYGIKQDNLGGIFGVQSGCNAYVNLFFCIYLAYIYYFYTINTERIGTFSLKLAVMLVLASFAEVKFIYIEFIIIIMIATAVTKFSMKKMFIILIATIVFLYGYQIFLQVFPDTDLSPDYLVDYMTNGEGYTASGDIGRFGFIEYINSRYLDGWFDKLLGLGLGNCDYATGYDILTSPFYLENEASHYYWMQTSFIYLESGIIGLVFHFGFLIIVGFQCLTKRSKSNAFSVIAFLCVCVAILNTFYNISLRIESGYMLYFVMALPWCDKESKGLKGKESEIYVI